MNPSGLATAHPGRSGFSLLEVLVACGILVVGLASVAAILPAAAARLGEAAAHDRSATAAIVAFGEIQTRQLVRPALFPSGTLSGTAFTPRAVVFGETISLTPSSNTLATGLISTSGSLAVTAATGSVSLSSGGSVGVTAMFSGTVPVISSANALFLNSRIGNDTVADARRGYFLEDEVRFDASLTGDVPVNSFENNARRFNRGVCWGALISPFPAGTSADLMRSARVSVAVFRKPAAPTALTLTLVSGTATEGIFQISGANTPASLQRTILKPCSNVLTVPPPSSDLPPTWLAIRSSWLTGANPLSTSSSATTQLIFEDRGAVTPFLISGTTLNVIGFDQLLLVTERIVPVR